MMTTTHHHHLRRRRPRRRPHRRPRRPRRRRRRRLLHRLLQAVTVTALIMMMTMKVPTVWIRIRLEHPPDRRRRHRRRRRHPSRITTLEITSLHHLRRLIHLPVTRVTHRRIRLTQATRHRRLALRPIKKSGIHFYL